MHGDLQFILDWVHEAGKLIVCMNVGKRNSGIVAHPENAIDGIEWLGVRRTGHRSGRAVVESLGDACHVGNAVDKHNIHGQFPLVSGIAELWGDLDNIANHWRGVCAG